MRPLLLGLAAIGLAGLNLFEPSASGARITSQGLVLSLALTVIGSAMLWLALWRRAPTRLPPSVYDEDPNPDYMASNNVSGPARQTRRN